MKAKSVEPESKASTTRTKAREPDPAAMQSSPAVPLLQLQRTHGNSFVQRMLLQAQREEGEAEVSPEVENAIQRSRGGGQTLNDSVMAKMESTFGADFSHVRVHTDGEADNLNRALNARAFTLGQDIFFRRGEYNPGNSQGQELIAHELTHVLQQAGESPRRKLVVGESDDEYEQEADQVAQAVMRMEHKVPQFAINYQMPQLQRAANVQVQQQSDAEEKKDDGQKPTMVSESVDVSAGPEATAPTLREREKTAVIQSKPSGVIQRGGPLAAAVAAGSLLQEGAAGFQMLSSVLTPMTQGDLQVTWPNSPIGVTWLGKPNDVDFLTRRQNQLIIEQQWDDHFGIEMVNVKLRCHVQYNGPEVQATFSFDASGRRSRLGATTSVVVNNPLSLETGEAPEIFQDIGVRRYPIVRIPIEFRIDFFWPFDNYNMTFELVLSGIYGFGAPGESGIQNKLVEMN